MSGIPAAVSPALLDHVLGSMHLTTLFCSRQQHEHGYRMESRVIQDWNFIYTIRGLPVWVVAGVEHALPPQTLILVPPGIEHHALCRTPEVTLGSLHVLATLPSGQDVFRLLGPPLLQMMPSGSRFDQYFRAFIAEFDRPHHERIQMFPGWAHLITRELFRHDADCGLLQARSADPLVADLLDEIQRHLDRPLTLAGLARRAGYSPQHLNRVFQRVLGTTPLKYLAATRLERAAELLRDQRLTVTEVARRVGFPDPAYFSRQFVRRFGVTPSAYHEGGGSESPDSGSRVPG
jgi:AraC-like DNA-binding protein